MKPSALEAEAEEVLAGVTPGPWHTYASHRNHVELPCAWGVWADGADYEEVDGLGDEATATFIAWSRTGVPALLAALRQFREENDRQATLIAGLIERCARLLQQIGANRE